MWKQEPNVAALVCKPTYPSPRAVIFPSPKLIRFIGQIRLIRRPSTLMPAYRPLLFKGIWRIAKKTRKAESSRTPLQKRLRVRIMAHVLNIC